MRPVRLFCLVAVVALTGSGCTLYGWGSNSAGELGDGTNFDRAEPAAAAVNPNWLKVDAGASFACAISDARELYC
jgi:alpha-tubulin suppressor-like RCC1 family protein